MTSMEIREWESAKQLHTNKSQNEVVVKFKNPFIAMEYVYMN